MRTAPTTFFKKFWERNRRCPNIPIKLARGIEPPTRGLQNRCSTNWATPAQILLKPMTPLHSCRMQEVGRPTDYKSVALPTELHRRKDFPQIRLGTPRQESRGITFLVSVSEGQNRCSTSAKILGGNLSYASAGNILLSKNPQSKNFAFVRLKTPREQQSLHAKSVPCGKSETIYTRFYTRCKVCFPKA